MGTRWVNRRWKYHRRHWLCVGAPGVGDCVELRDQGRNHIERDHQEEFATSGDRVRSAVAGDLAE